GAATITVRGRHELAGVAGGRAAAEGVGGPLAAGAGAVAIAVEAAAGLRGGRAVVVGVRPRRHRPALAVLPARALAEARHAGPGARAVAADAVDAVVRGALASGRAGGAVAPDGARAVS